MLSFLARLWTRIENISWIIAIAAFLLGPALTWAAYRLPDGALYDQIAAMAFRAGQWAPWILITAGAVALLALLRRALRASAPGPSHS